MKITRMGSEKDRYYYVFNKDEIFIELCVQFLLGCGFKNLEEYEDYANEKTSIKSWENKVDHFKNELYDIDIIYTIKKVILIIRTKEENKENLILGIEKFTQ